MQLASAFGRYSNVLRSSTPLSDDQIRSVAPSIFATDKHASRSHRYTYIPTIEVLRGLRREGFAPFMVCQSRTRSDANREHTKHMMRLRHAGQITGQDANEIILLNSHNGTSAYQMLAGVFRFVCNNGLVCGDTLADIRIPHKGDVIDQVIDGAFQVLEGFDEVDQSKDRMRALQLNPAEQTAFARAALCLRHDVSTAGASPVSEAQVLRARRIDDMGADLWSTFNRTQENLVSGGLQARSANGRRTTTRPVNAIDQNIKLNRALWILAQEMQKLAS
jgi:hypothetical protein